MKRIWLAFVVFASLSGCAIHSTLNRSGAGIVAWKNDLSAALVLPAVNEGERVKACMQTALTMHDVSAKVEASASDAILQVMEIIPTQPTPQELARIRTSIKETAQALNISTERTSFLMVGGFYLCQLQANGLDNGATKEIALAVIDAAKNIQDTRLPKEVSAAPTAK